MGRNPYRGDVLQRENLQWSIIVAHQEIDLDSSIEDVVTAHPPIVTWLIETHGIRVIRCGAPIWATVGELAEQHRLEPLEFLQGRRGQAVKS